ncbi:MAG: hypothetical protein QNI89_00165 [Desulfobacterales bacterium]|nr:hypothetical protein [Desulfobacterales bacterium]MDJ0854667.1 hypothetical protein [Desulfobacterales bacterium]MDJ0885671.1 hypothetical protein [Desulfobacterales bacterium]MDJ0991881.1 hypothetical protein [Desulfobacterales bacterium]
MEPSELVNILTAVLAVSIVILVIRLFRGDISDNKGGLVFAMVVLGVVIYFIRSDAGLSMIEHVLGSMSPGPTD